MTRNFSRNLGHFVQFFNIRHTTTLQFNFVYCILCYLATIYFFDLRVIGKGKQSGILCSFRVYTSLHNKLQAHTEVLMTLALRTKNIKHVCLHVWSCEGSKWANPHFVLFFSHRQQFLSYSFSWVGKHIIMYSRVNFLYVMYPEFVFYPAFVT